MLLSIIIIILILLTFAEEQNVIIESIVAACITMHCEQISRIFVLCIGKCLNCFLWWILFYRNVAEFRNIPEI